MGERSKIRTFILVQYNSIPLYNRKAYIAEMVSLMKQLSYAKIHGYYNETAKYIVQRVARYKREVHTPPKLARKKGESHDDYMDRIYEKGGYSWDLIISNNGESIKA